MGDGVAEAEEALAPAEAPLFEPAAARERALTVEEMRLLKALQTERLRIARRLGVPPRAVASEEKLRAIALARPERLEDAVFADVREPAAFLAVISRRDP
jgi:hypothetical protein